MEEYEAIHSSYRNHTVYTAPHPLGGAQLLSTLQLLDNTGIDDTTPHTQLYRYIVQALGATDHAYYRMGETKYIGAQ